MKQSFEYLQYLLNSGKLSRREFMKKTAALGLIAVSSQYALSGTSYAASKKGGRLKVALAEGSTTDTLDPQNYVDTFMMSVGFATHNTLTEIDSEGELVGDIAESWEATPDAKVWRFKLRKGIEFSNGKTLTVKDVITSINHHRGKDTKSGAKTNVNPIKNMMADGDDTLVFELKAGNADFPYLLVDYHLIIMPEVNGKADWKNYIGTGGYILKSFEPGLRCLLVRNPNYWKADRAHFDEVEIISVTDSSARQNALITGEVDVISRCDLRTVKLLERKPGINVEETTGFQHFTAPMLTTNSPFENNNIRRALKYAIDREQLLKVVLNGHGTLGNDHPIAPSIPFHADLKQRQYDPDKAKFYLKKAGLSRLSLDLSTADSAYSGAVDTAVLMKESAAKANVDINVVQEANDGYWSNIWMKKPWSIAYWGGRPTCDWMFSTAYAEGASWNDTFWSHERFNMLLIEGRSELDIGKRAEIYREMQQIVRDEGGVVVWAFANLESTLTTQPIAPLEYSTEKLTIINIEPEAYQAVVKWKDKSYDLVHLANNHILDCGEDGIQTTLNYLKSDNIGQIGINETAENQQRASITEVNGMRIGWVAHTYDLDSMPMPKNKPYLVNMTPFHMVAEPDTTLIEKQIQTCHAEGCDFVIVSLHWGLEFELYPHPDQLKWAHQFAEIGADLIIGHHPHVIQHMEIYRPKCDPRKSVPILYSLGNLTPIQSHPATVSSLVARLKLAKGKLDGETCIVPTQLDLTPVVTLQLNSSANSPLGIYELSSLLTTKRANCSDGLNKYVKEVADYVDLTIGSDWRNQ
ncbi:MAG: hypothetical protein HOD92_06790 [Deltaproteobacteria bacterium]|nr:hypothetical protein [Deltaproteobacteria bacterium]MBT4525219.1 hypothetical protein [Deltaproteobacteria bacterium]